MQVMIDALERASSSDREKIREALATTNITSGKAMLLPYERISFEADGQNHNAPLVINQIQKRKLRAVYPPHLIAPGVTAVWPIPPMK
jgi:branched-chain amino acid transport system substrate-binding protein